MIKLEVCANGLNSALAAEEGGAYRVELCDNLLEGGTTPSFGQIALAKKLLKVKVYPIIRPRGGDFIYSDLEFEIMKADIVNCKALHCDGVVFGMLTKTGRVDLERCKILIDLARPMAVAFHRAFDVSSDLYQALEDIITLGFERVLTSGSANTALEGAGMLKALINKAGGRIEVMPGSGINVDNVAALIALTGAKAVHGSLSQDVPFRLTSRDAVKAVNQILSGLH